MMYDFFARESFLKNKGGKNLKKYSFLLNFTFCKNFKNFIVFFLFYYSPCVNKLTRGDSLTVERVPPAIPGFFFFFFLNQNYLVTIEFRLEVAV